MSLSLVSKSETPSIRQKIAEKLEPLSEKSLAYTQRYLLVLDELEELFQEELHRR